MEALLGSTLLRQGATLPTEEALQHGTTAVALYFSAHWCPPCRRFTPQLAKMYENIYKPKGMEVVFISADNKKGEFEEYYAEQPWLSLPWGAGAVNESNAIQKKLNKKFKVNGIPCLVILKPDGTLITTDGRDRVGEPQKFPWIPKPFTEILAGCKIVAPGGKPLELTPGKPIALYFSAHWCGPCRQFTPQLKKFYEEGLRDKMEIVFVSSDKDQKSFDGYHGSMPWPAVDFACRAEKDELSAHFGVEGIPFFAVLNADGTVITNNGRSKVMGDPTGASFPEGWAPQPVSNVNDDPSGVNSETCFLVYSPSAASAAALTSVAKEYQAAAGGVVADMEIFFYTAPDGGIMQQIRQLTNAPKGTVEDRLVIMDFPAGGEYHVAEAADITPDYIKGKIADHKAGRIAMSKVRK